MQEIPCHALIKKVKYKWWMVRSLWTREKCYPTRFKWHRQRKPGCSLQSFALKLRSCFCKCCFSSPTAMEFMLWPIPVTYCDNSNAFFGSLIAFPCCWHDRDALTHPYLTILCQQLFSPHRAIIPGSSSTILRWIVQTALTAVAGQRHTLQCIVLTGSPTLEATTTVNAEANSIVNPLREA